MGAKKTTKEREGENYFFNSQMRRLMRMTVLCLHLTSTQPACQLTINSFSSARDKGAGFLPGETVCMSRESWRSRWSQEPSATDFSNQSLFDVGLPTGMVLTPVRCAL